MADMTKQVRQGCFFTHLGMVRSYQRSKMYSTQIAWVEMFGVNGNVGTSNAGGLFVANGLPLDKLSFSQGSYSSFQYLVNSRAEATVFSVHLFEDVQASLDLVSQDLVDKGKAS
ncbi:uncharacterized protein LY79DRAFT_590536 [Colletotrichum navitas]|uniref:Uncharacterized protein n=1 Tax=Colletotrichum navitas TaxID=681940 RepID=A0AAD8PY91_9PEZI|nr:uncharacterized protein LY79DRAFT_590536 [Colletotrichum navitas]KAK1590338.1 hypothetical protein LY79DRAFT_590536 [Colletotrichum navitas]